MDGMGWMDGMDISQTTRNTRAPGGANKSEGETSVKAGAE